MSIQEQVEQWMSQQSDIIACPLGATMRLATCKNRQKKLPAYMSQDNDDIGPSSYFGRCAILGCQYYNPPPKKKGKSLEETRRGYRAEYSGGKRH